MRSCVLYAGLVSLSAVFGQQAADKPSFEVASIKPADPNPTSPMFTSMRADSGRVEYANITLKDCIRAAYRVRDFQIQGPDWISNARFEIIAKLPAGASKEQIPEMLQGLLEERFKLVLQHDMKEHAVYALVAGPAGPKLKPAQAREDNDRFTAVGPDGKPRAGIMISFQASGVRVFTPSNSLASFVEVMSRFTERPVVDLTGMKGLYDLDLTFAPETTRGLPPSMAAEHPVQTSSEPVVSVFDAVKQYGLRLDRRKAPMELLIVTHAERTPTEN